MTSKRPLYALASLTVLLLASGPVPVATAQTCSTLGLSCVSVWGTGALLNENSGCRVGDALATRNCVVRWNAGASGSASLGGVLTLQVRGQSATTRNCAIGVGGFCAIQSFDTDMTYRLNCNGQWVSADLWADVAATPPASEHTSRSVWVPACV